MYALVAEIKISILRLDPHYRSRADVEDSAHLFRIDFNNFVQSHNLLPSKLYTGLSTAIQLNMPSINLHSALRLRLDHRRAVAFAPFAARGAEILPPLARSVDGLAA